MTSFMVVDEERSDVSLRTVVRTIRPEFRRTLLERERNVAGTCFRANLFEPTPPSGDGLGSRLHGFPFAR